MNQATISEVFDPAKFRLSDRFQNFDTLKLRARGKRAYYAIRTCWWGFDIYYTIPGKHALPCDPRGCPMMEGPALDFIAAAERNPDFYGMHKLLAFAAAHHGNVLTADGRPTSFEGWEKYNAILDYHWDKFSARSEA